MILFYFSSSVLVIPINLAFSLEAVFFDAAGLGFGLGFSVKSFGLGVLKLLKRKLTAQYLSRQTDWRQKFTDLQLADPFIGFSYTSVSV